MRVEVVAFRPDHLLDFEPLPLFAPLGDVKGRVLALAKERPSFPITTLIVDGKPAAVMGMNPLWPGVAEAWAVTSDRVRAAPIWFHREVRRLVAYCERTYQYHRVQITVPMGFPVGLRWAVMLGFEPESRLFQYGPDRQDHMMFRRLRCE